jgi:protein-tyrosine phosphatase
VGFGGANYLNPKLYWIPNSSPGRIAISARPRGGDWLEDEISGWRKQGVDVVVSLLTPSENDELKLKDEAGLSKTRGIRFLSLPIEDRGTPPSSAEVEQLVLDLSSEIQRGKNVAVHCRQGIGRSSLISAALLISSGEDLEQALQAISRARGLEVPETVEQRRWLDQFAKTHSSGALARHSR